MKEVIRLANSVDMNGTVLLVPSFNGVKSGWYVKYRDEVREVSSAPFNPLTPLNYIFLEEGFPFILEGGIELEFFSSEIDLYVKYQGSLHSVKEVYVKYQGQARKVKEIYKKEDGQLKGRKL